jgi:adenine phosphoribosyltransferase
MTVPTFSVPPRDEALALRLAASIRTLPDYPKPGILFRDVTTLFGDAVAFRLAVDALVSTFAGKADGASSLRRPAMVAGMEARGFILGAPVALGLDAGFVPVRKKGKLPYKTVKVSYQLEYGTDEMELHEDAVTPGQRVLLVDDLLATGGTALGAISLLQKLGADVVGTAFLVDLPELGGAAKIRALGIPVVALTAFSGH